MKISTRGRYALRVMIDLAKNNKNNEQVSLTSLSNANCISQKYLEQIVPLLSRAGLLKSSRGNKGGYSLLREPSQITLGDILRATEGTLAPVPCLEYATNDCELAKVCPSLKVWSSLNSMVNNFVNNLTLEMIVDGNIPNVLED